MTTAQIIGLWVGAIAVATVKLVARTVVDQAWKAVHKPRDPGLPSA